MITLKVEGVEKQYPKGVTFEKWYGNIRINTTTR